MSQILNNALLALTLVKLANRSLLIAYHAWILDSLTQMLILATVNQLSMTPIYQGSLMTKLPNVLPA